MHKVISLVLLSIADECADERLRQELTTQLVRDVDKGFATKDAEAGNVGLVPAPGLLGCAVAKRTRRRHVVQKSCIPKGIPPVSVGQLSLNEHCVDPLDKCAVHVLCYPIVLQCVSCGQLVFDPLLLEK